MSEKINLEEGKFIFTESDPRELMNHIAAAYLAPHKLHPEYERMKKEIADRMMTEYGFLVNCVGGIL